MSHSAQLWHQGLGEEGQSLCSKDGNGASKCCVDTPCCEWFAAARWRFFPRESDWLSSSTAVVLVCNEIIFWESVKGHRLDRRPCGNRLVVLPIMANAYLAGAFKPFVDVLNQNFSGFGAIGIFDCLIWAEFRVGVGSSVLSKVVSEMSPKRLF